MKKGIALIMAAVLAMSALAGCGSVTDGSSSTTAAATTAAATEAEAQEAEAGETEAAEAAPAESAGGLYPEIQVAVAADMEDLTPCKPNGTTRSNVFWSIYESLFDYDNDNNLVPNLAKGYTEVSDTEWDIELFEEIYDSDGNHITADDVVASVNWLVDSGNNIRYTLFDSIEKIDDYTVRYHWTEKPASIGDLEFPLVRTFIFSETAWDQYNFAVQPVATGNYIVESFTPGSTLVLVANDNYWADNTSEDVSMREDYHTSRVERIVYNTITESSQAVIGLEMGSIDFCDYVPVASLPEFEAGGQYADKYNVTTMESTDYYYMLPNMSEDNTLVGNDLNLRLAIYYSLDNETIATVMGNDNVPLYSLGTTAYPDFDESWNDDPSYINTYDPELAAEYLAASNYNGEEITLIGLSNEEVKLAMQMMQVEMEAIGLNVKIQTYEKSFLLTVLEETTGWDLYVSSTGGNTITSSWERIISQSENDGWTAGWLKDDKLQELFDTASADATHTPENLKACLDYVYEIGCAYGISVWSSSIVYTKDITDICYREGYWVIGGCKFAD